MNRIIINNLKGIKFLDFLFPEKAGVYLIVGPNGCGKTTLLTCLDRIGNSFAFARGFYNMQKNTKYDQYINAKIEYIVNEKKVVFSKKKVRWVATKKGDSQYLKGFGITASFFVKADSKRIEAIPDEISGRNIKDADKRIIDRLNIIFETDRFSSLKILKMGKGRRGKIAHVIQENSVFYSEKRFSTGEIAIIHLIESLNVANANDMVLLDEAEMALHPRVQLKLLDFLQEIAKEKNLIIFISTHSPAMIRQTDPDKIFLLEDDNDKTKIVNPCSPAYAIGCVDVGANYDHIFFVEDEMAKISLKKMIERFDYEFFNSPKFSCVTAVIPVGGYLETAKFAMNTRKQLFSSSNVIAFLDEDAFFDLDKRVEFNAIFTANPNIVRSLGFTPEVKLIDMLENNTGLQKNIKKVMHFDLSGIKYNAEYIQITGRNERKIAKNKFDYIVKKCIDSSSEKENIVINELVKLVVNEFDKNDIKSMLCPVFECGI